MIFPCYLILDGAISLTLSLSQTFVWCLTYFSSPQSFWQTDIRRCNLSHSLSLSQTFVWCLTYFSSPQSFWQTGPASSSVRTGVTSQLISMDHSLACSYSPRALSVSTIIQPWSDPGACQRPIILSPSGRGAPVARKRSIPFLIQTGSALNFHSMQKSILLDMDRVKCDGF